MMKRLYRNGITMLSGILAMATVGLLNCQAVQPNSVTEGRVLFEQDWSPRNPITGNDGLGPLFNSTSCVRCHFQGGVGGAGDSRFNVHTLGIEEINFSGGPTTKEIFTQMVQSIHPGFVQSDGSIVSTLPLSHLGGSTPYAMARQTVTSKLPVSFSSSGGAMDASEVRYVSASPITLKSQRNGQELTIAARLFQRNTTALFGAGIIDRVSDRDISIQANIQERHPEISGRPATLIDGRFGKFGWRGNIATLVEFIDIACANEVGLKTRRKPQPSDPMNPHYRNPGIDVSDMQIRAMRDFITALPTPVQLPANDSRHASQIQRGEQVFASVGCAVCHVKNLGSASGIYSDMLLHDMGFESMDLSHAEPYVIRITPQTSLTLANAPPLSIHKRSFGGYGGGTQTLSTASSGNRNNFTITTPRQPQELMKLIEISSNEIIAETDTNDDQGTAGQAKTVKLIKTKFVRVHFKPTNFNQEWRTPPLWGVRDSAPYMHDGRAETLLEAIAVHEGEASATRDRFLKLPLPDRRAVLAFLETLAAPSNIPQPAM